MTLKNRSTIDQTLNLKEKEKDDCILTWPHIGNSPVSEFTTEGYISRAFPTLFPTGAADLLSPRLHQIKPNPYFKYLMKYKDGRFARHPRFRFFAMNSMMRWTALNNSHICINRSAMFKNIQNAEQLKEILQKDENAYKNVLAYNSNLRSTSAYWFLRSRELIDMVETLGPPTAFLTLSAADLYWPELGNILGEYYDGYDKLSERQKLQRRQRLINNNPLTVAFFFKERAEYFIHNILVPKFKIKDMWYRVEFQHRGSPHIHGLIWIEGAPKLTFKKGPEQQLQLEKIKLFFDELISTWNPDPNV